MDKDKITIIERENELRGLLKTILEYQGYSNLSDTIEVLKSGLVSFINDDGVDLEQSAIADATYQTMYLIEFLTRLRENMNTIKQLHPELKEHIR